MQYDLFHDEQVIDKEEWKEIKGFEGHYFISSLGRIKSLTTLKNKGNPIVKETIFKLYANKDGYPNVVIGKEKIHQRTAFLVHRLVALYFVPNPLNKEQVNHKDGNKSNNNYKNLEWMTVGENLEHSYKVLKNTYRQIKIRNRETGEVFNSLAEASRHYNVAISIICHVVKYRNGYFKRMNIQFDKIPPTVNSKHST